MLWSLVHFFPRVKRLEYEAIRDVSVLRPGRILCALLGVRAAVMASGPGGMRVDIDGQARPLSASNFT